MFPKSLLPFFFFKSLNNCHLSEKTKHLKNENENENETETENEKGENASDCLVLTTSSKRNST